MINTYFTVEVINTKKHMVLTKGKNLRDKRFVRNDQILRCDSIMQAQAELLLLTPAQLTELLPSHELQVAIYRNQLVYNHGMSKNPRYLPELMLAIEASELLN